MAVAESMIWQLDKYARYMLPRQGSSTGHWNHFDNTDDLGLVMTLTEANHLVVLRGSVVLESHSLVTAHVWMRGLCKNDSLLFLYRHGKGTRRFRVKFVASGGKTASQVCSNAAVKLSKLFTVHITTPPHPMLKEAQSREKEDCATGSASASASLVGEIALGTMAQNREKDDCATGSTSASASLVGEIALGTMAQVFLGGSGNRLPAAHRTRQTPYDGTRVTSLPDDVIIQHLRLFLTDPTFPAFVNQVEKQLQTIITECQEHS